MENTPPLPGAPPVPAVQRIAAVLWPSFVLSGIAAALFFAAFDPVEVLACNGYPVASRLGAYTVGFFLFWLLTAAAGALALWFARPCTGERPGSG